MSRKTIVAGNWKMNKTPAETSEFIKELLPEIKDSKNVLIAAVPFVDLPAALEAAKGSNLKIAAQNMHWKESGAYTGEVSGAMLKSMDVPYVILGHSERREYFADTDETVNLKAKAALSYGITPIICCGETLQQRKDGIMQSWIEGQIEGALKDITAEQVAGLIIAYEPIWAIGTGETATSEQAEEVCGIIRKKVAALYDDATAEAVHIQYGGSVKPSNSNEILSMPNIDGGLIGGASLKVADFATLAAYEC